MKIKYFGNSCFLLKTKDSKLITNPKGEGVKVSLKKISPDIIVLTHEADVKENNYYLVSTCGEYEVKDIFIYGYQSSQENGCADLYMFDLEGIHLGMVDSSVKSIKESVLDEMGIVNVLFISLSDKASMKLSKLTDLVSKIDPQIVIPMDYTKENLDEFNKVLGVKSSEKVKDINIKRSDFLEEDMPTRVVVLEK